MLSETFGASNAAGNERGQEEVLEQVQGSSSNSKGLLPPFGLHKLSQLPTPQSSPSNVAAYAPDLNGAYASPVSNSTRDTHRIRASARRSATPLTREDNHVASTASFMTPESSPVISRKAMPPVTPIAGPSSIPHTPVRNAEEVGTSRTGSVVDRKMSVDTAVQPLAPAPIISTPVSSHSRAMTPASRLSSPFQDRLSAPEHRSAKSHSKSPMRVDSPSHDALSLSRPEPSLPPLATPVPQRPVGGEIQRIHLQLAADRAERLHEMEARRPEYLVREKRPHPDADIPTLDELDAANATLGVKDSPVKGRRLQLFQATSEETFEQSLLAGGYPGYGQSPAYKTGEPSSPSPSGKRQGALSQRALQWLQQATPGQPGPSTTPATEASVKEEPEWVPSEQETRKRRRLDAFKHDSEKGSGSKLFPVEVEGRGRLLLNMLPESSAGVRRVNVTRRRKVRRPPRRAPGGESRDEQAVQPNWLDSAFPWSLRAQERTHTERMEEEQRLKWIERFLERDSESDSGEDDQEIRPPLQSHENDQVAHRRGRGKMVPLRVSASTSIRAPGGQNVLTPSDPADARAALLSKRSVRSLAGRRKEGMDDEVDEVRCIGCNRGDDGNELVQCDECQTWYHLPCIGIKHVSELGKEEDPWFCNKCLDLPPDSPLVEPMFVPTDDRLLEPHRDSFFLQEPSLFESPAPNWQPDLREPQTPVRGSDSNVRDGGFTRTFSSRSSWGDSSRVGPSTPDSSARTVRVYGGGGGGAFAFDRDVFDPETPFDPTTTPSRGIKFSGGPPPTLGLSTPKNGLGLGLWATRGGQTPTPAAKWTAGGGREWRHSWDDGVGGGGGGPGGGSPYPRSIYSAAYDDTPVTRAPRVRERYSALSTGPGGRRLWNEPSAAAGFARGARRGSPEPPLAGVDGDVQMETEA